MNLLPQLKQRSGPRCAFPGRLRLQVEELESRLVPYSVSGNAWPHPELVTLSFVPDGTILGTAGNNYIYSNLVAKMNAHPGWTTATWQNEIIRAAQVWAQYTNINFDIITDNGDYSGSGDYQQGDPNFGDIRIGGYGFSPTYLAGAFLPPPVNNFSLAGDINFNTNQGFNIGTTYDLFTVAVHEIGHALGLSHTTLPQAVMYPSYLGVRTTLNNDDINGIRAIYSPVGLPRSPDLYDAVIPNNSFLTSTVLTALVDPITLTSVHTGLDITTTSDVDYYTVVAPLGTSNTLTVNVQTAGLSLLRQSVTVYAADQSTVLASGSSAGSYDGTTVSLTINNVNPLQVFYIKVAGADTTAFGTGKYAMTLNFGTEPSPTVPLPSTQTPNGDPLSGGGAQHERRPIRIPRVETRNYDLCGIAHVHGRFGQDRDSLAQDIRLFLSSLPGPVAGGASAGVQFTDWWVAAQPRIADALRELDQVENSDTDSAVDRDRVAEAAWERILDMLFTEVDLASI